MDVSGILDQQQERQCVPRPPRASLAPLAAELTSPHLPARRKAITVTKEIPVELDLGLLAVFDPNPIDLESYQCAPSPLPPRLLLLLRRPHLTLARNRTDKERSLLDHARDGIQLLVNELWSQKTRIVDDDVIADLPPIATGLPREKPVRPSALYVLRTAHPDFGGPSLTLCARPLARSCPSKRPRPSGRRSPRPRASRPRRRRTAWCTTRSVRSGCRAGATRARTRTRRSSGSTRCPTTPVRPPLSSPLEPFLGPQLTPVPPADPNFDPRAAAKQERKARSLKNESQRLQNLQRVAANAAQQVQASSARTSQRDARKQEIEHTLKASKKSTASLGKFDDKLKGEGREKNIKRKVRPVSPLPLVRSSPTSSC